METEVLKIKDFRGTIWRGFGTSLCWFANGIKSSDEFRDYISDLLFNQTNPDGLQLNIVRYNIGASTQNDISGFRPGGAVPVWDILNLDKNIDQNQLYFLKAAKRNGVTTFEAFANSPPSEMTRSGNVAGSSSWKNFFIFDNFFPKLKVPDFTLTTNLKWNRTQDFTDYLVKVTNYLIEKENIPFTTISPINEPSGPGWIVGNNQEGCFYGYPNRTAVFRNLHKSIKCKTNIKLKTSGCEENNMFQALCGILFNPFAWFYVDQYNIHRYRIGNALGFDTCNFEDSNWIRSIINFIINRCLGKRIWVSEFGMGYERGVTNYQDIQNVFNFANYLMDDLIYLGAEAWVYWQVIENKSGNGWGSMQIPFNNPNINDIERGSQFTAFQHFTHFIKPGDQILSLSKPKNKGVKWVGSFNPITNDINIIILCTNTADITLEIPFGIPGIPGIPGITTNNIFMITTTGNDQFSKTKKINFELKINKICIQKRSLTSLRYTLTHSA